MEYSNDVDVELVEKVILVDPDAILRGVSTDSLPEDASTNDALPQNTNSAPREEKDCMICFESTDQYVMNCEHPCHRECFGNYCNSRIEKGLPTMPCPYPNCKSELTVENVKTFIDPEDFIRYEKFILQMALRTIPNIRFCPGANCEYAVVACRSHKVIECLAPECGIRFCFQCRKEEHDGPCRKEKYGDDVLSETIKPCPNCLIPASKDEGCNKMHCPCGTDWCWICGSPAGALHFQIEGQCGLFQGVEENFRTGRGMSLLIAMLILPILLAFSPPILLAGDIFLICGVFFKTYDMYKNARQERLDRMEQELGHPLPQDERDEFLTLSRMVKIRRFFTTAMACLLTILATPGLIIAVYCSIPLLLVFVYILAPIDMIIRRITSSVNNRKLRQRMVERNRRLEEGLLM